MWGCFLRGEFAADGGEKSKALGNKPRILKDAGSEGFALGRVARYAEKLRPWWGGGRKEMTAL